MDSFVITNVVASTNLDIAVDLHGFTFMFGNVIKNNKMQNVIWRHKKIGATALLFSNGYISVHGSRSEVETRKSLRQFARLLWRRGFNPKLDRIKINTITGVFKFKYGKID